MALKDHSLDDKIISAAMEEFSEKGYMGGSLRKIAEKAGVTVGAIQTRYRSKDELFVSLLRPFLEDIEATFRNVREDYYSAAGGDMLSQLEGSIRHESQAILHLIFAHYEHAVLFFYRSAGSSLERAYDMLVKRKIDESILFFERQGYGNIDTKLLGLLISVQFDCYRRIVAEYPDRDAAESCMNSLMTYHLGGWMAIFKASEKEDMEDEI